MDVTSYGDQWDGCDPNLVLYPFSFSFIFVLEILNSFRYSNQDECTSHLLSQTILIG